MPRSNFCVQDVDDVHCSKPVGYPMEPFSQPLAAQAFRIAPQVGNAPAAETWTSPPSKCWKHPFSRRPHVRAPVGYPSLPFSHPVAPQASLTAPAVTQAPVAGLQWI